MFKVIEIGLLVMIPLLWGLAVEFVFQRLRGRTQRSQAPRAEQPPVTEHDWVI